MCFLRFSFVCLSFCSFFFRVFSSFFACFPRRREVFGGVLSAEEEEIWSPGAQLHISMALFVRPDDALVPLDRPPSPVKESLVAESSATLCLTWKRGWIPEKVYIDEVVDGFERALWHLFSCRWRWPSGPTTCRSMRMAFRPTWRFL